MSNERPSDHNRIHKVAGPFKGKSSSLLRLSRAPASSTIDMDTSSDNSTNIFLPNVAPVVGSPTTVFATGTMEASTTVSSPISAPASSLIHALRKQLGWTAGPETPPTHMSADSRSPLSPSSSDSVMQAATELEFNPSTRDSGLGLFANAQNILINGGTFINNVHHVSAGEGQMKTPVSRKPNSSPLIIGRKEVLDKLGKIFVHSVSRDCRDNINYLDQVIKMILEFHE